MPTPTERNGFRKPDPGSDNNTWGSNLNSAVFDLVDAAIDGWVKISTSGTTTLNADQYVANQARMRCIHYSAMSSGTLIIPNVEKWYIVWAELADVVVSAGSLVTATVKAGDIALVMCDGSDCTKVQSNDHQGLEQTNAGTPLSGSSLVTKDYADGLAFASTNIPGINVGTIYKLVSNDGAAGLWKRGLPVSSSTTLGQTLKSTGIDGYPEDTSTWDWDGYQGKLTKSANYTVVLADRQKRISCTGTFTLSLTSAATLGGKFNIRVVNDGTGLITIDPSGSETITLPGQSAKTTVIIAPNEFIDLQGDGASNFDAQWTASPGPHVIIQEQAASGSATSTTNSAYNTRNLTTVVTPSPLASLSAKQVTLEPGTWHLAAFGCVTGTNGTRIRIRNVTDSSTTVLGATLMGGDYGSVATAGAISVAEGVVTITSAKTFEVQQYIGGNTATGFNMGFPLNTGDANVFAELRATRIAP